jgi:hypothetical protein
MRRVAHTKLDFYVFSAVYPVINISNTKCKISMIAAEYLKYAQSPETHSAH